MRTVYESLQSYLGLSCEDRKHKARDKMKGYGFPLLRRACEGKESRGKAAEPHPGKQRREKSSSRRVSSSRVHSVCPTTHSVEFDTRFSATEESQGIPSKSSLDSSIRLEEQRSELAEEDIDVSPVEDGCGRGKSRVVEKTEGISKLLKDLALKGDMVSRDCLTQAQFDLSGRCRLEVGVVHPVRNSSGDSFDKCTTEYYSGGKKWTQSGRCGSQQTRPEPTDAREVAHVNEVSDQPFVRSQLRQFPDASDIDGLRLSGSVVHASCATETNDVKERVNQVDCNSEEFPSTSQQLLSNPRVPAEVCRETNETFRELDDDVGSLCEAGCSGLQTGEVQSICRSASAPSPNVEYRRKFPPPLSSMPMQGYSDMRGQSPGPCISGFCLRSLRIDGRFLLQEVKAPPQKFFRVSRRDGRLKLELISPVDDYSLDDSVDDPQVEGDTGEIQAEAMDKTGLKKEMVTMDYCQESECAKDCESEVASQPPLNSTGDVPLTKDETEEKGGPQIGAPPSLSCTEIRESFQDRPSVKGSWVYPMDWVPAF